jgi:hypothetical protein
MIGAAGAVLVVGLAFMSGVARAADDKTYVMKITLPTLNDSTHLFAKNYAAALERDSDGRINRKFIRRANWARFRDKSRARSSVRFSALFFRQSSSSASTSGSK